MSSRGKVIAFGAVALVVAVSGLVLARYFSSAKKQEETKRPPKDFELPKKSRRPFSECYELKQELDSTSFPNEGVEARVRLGKSKSTGQQVVVKVVSKDKSSEALAVECKIAAALDHPYIIRLLETFDEPDADYIVFEYLKGGELFDRVVAKVVYPEAEAKVLFAHLLEAVAYMHDMGVVHRNLKPENIMLCEAGDDTTVKITDFGYAKWISDSDDAPQCRECLGTPGYMAPEVIRKDPYGREVDIWSLGVTCYIVLGGYPPFSGEPLEALFSIIKKGEYEFHEDFWGSVSPEAKDFIKSMLCMDQKTRWTAKQLLKHPWLLSPSDTEVTSA